jgi:Fe-S cluster biogenesis protein NfuA
MSLNKEELATKINFALEQLRPYLNEDGGDMELIEITDEGIAKVRLLGNCSGCSMSAMTLKAGLEEQVRSVAPEIVAIEAVNADEF